MLLPNARPMLFPRLQRWSNIDPALGGCHLFAGMLPEDQFFMQAQYIKPMLVQCWSTVYNAGPTLYQHWVIFVGMFFMTKVKCT